MIYISLTTVPLRLSLWESFSKNIESLLSQKTNREYKVCLNIPIHYKNNDNEEYILPQELLDLQSNHSKLIINRVTNDYGPVVKITGVLSVSNDPNDILIICDDDHVYHKDMLEYHLKKLNQFPKSAICFRGDVPIEKREWEEDGIKKYILHPTHLLFPVKHDLQLKIPGHWHSVGYKRSYFEEDFLLDEFLSMSNNDDILVGYYLKKKQIDIRCVVWESETDWRPVNCHGRPANSFPIVYSLPYPSSGFNEFRKQNDSCYGSSTKELEDYLHNNDIIFEEK